MSVWLYESEMRIVSTFVAAGLFSCAASRPGQAPASEASRTAAPDGATITDAAPLVSTAPSSAAPPPTPMSADLPSIAVSDLEAFHPNRCERGLCVVAAVPPNGATAVNVTNDAPPETPIRAWVAIVMPHATLRIAPQDDRAFRALFVPNGSAAPSIAAPSVRDLLGVVLSGRARVRPLGDHAPQPATLASWAAFLAPGQNVEISAIGDEPVGLVLASAADAPSLSGRERLTVRSLAESPDLSWAGGAFHARIAFEAPLSPAASLEVLMGSANAIVPEHDHPTSWETLVALRASGTLHLPAHGREPTRERNVSTGAIAFVPDAVRHAWQPDGQGPLVAIQLYTPPGPEQRFRALASR